MTGGMSGNETKALHHQGPRGFCDQGRQNKDKGDPHNDELLWEMKTHGNNSIMHYEIYRGLVSWPNIQLFLALRGINWLGGNNTNRFCFLARLAMNGNLLPGIWICRGIHRGACPSTALRGAPCRRAALRLQLKHKFACITEALWNICLVCVTHCPHARQGAPLCLALDTVPRVRDFEVSPWAGGKGRAGIHGDLWVQGAAKLLGTSIQGSTFL